VSFSSSAGSTVEPDSVPERVGSGSTGLTFVFRTVFTFLDLPVLFFLRKVFLDLDLVDFTDLVVLLEQLDLSVWARDRWNWASSRASSLASRVSIACEIIIDFTVA